MIAPDQICPYCLERRWALMPDGTCEICRRPAIRVQNHFGQIGTMTELQWSVYQQEWPSYLTRTECIRILEAFQLGESDLDEWASWTRHETEATVIIIAGFVSMTVPAYDGSAAEQKRKKARWQLRRMAGRMGFEIPDT